MLKQKLSEIKLDPKKGLVDIEVKEMLRYFPSHQSSEVQQHIKKALFFHRPTYKWAQFCPEYWSDFFSESKNQVWKAQDVTAVR